MPTRPSAKIIAFPAAPRATTNRNLVVAPLPGERLQLALAALEAAVAAQREAVASWRGALGTLRGSVRGIGESLHTYQQQLGGLGERVADINANASRLEAWADAALGMDQAPKKLFNSPPATAVST